MSTSPFGLAIFDPQSSYLEALLVSRASQSENQHLQKGFVGFGLAISLRPRLFFFSAKMDRGGSRTAAVQGIIILTLLVSGFVIALRVYARTYVKKGAFGLDDWLIVLTWVSASLIRLAPLVDSRCAFLSSSSFWHTTSAS